MYTKFHVHLPSLHHFSSYFFLSDSPLIPILLFPILSIFPFYRCSFQPFPAHFLSVLTFRLIPPSLDPHGPNLFLFSLFFQIFCSISSSLLSSSFSSLSLLYVSLQSLTQLHSHLIHTSPPPSQTQSLDESAACKPLFLTY